MFYILLVAANIGAAGQQRRAHKHAHKTLFASPPCKDARLNFFLFLFLQSLVPAAIGAGLAAKIANLMVLGFQHCEQCTRDHDLNEFRKSVLNFIVSFEFQFDSFTAAPAN